MIGFVWLRIETVARSYRHGTESSSYVKEGEILDYDKYS
jgi:hypothetical protein